MRVGAHDRSAETQFDGSNWHFLAVIPWTETRQGLCYFRMGNCLWSSLIATHTRKHAVHAPMVHIAPFRPFRSYTTGEPEVSPDRPKLDFGQKLSALTDSAELGT